MDLAQPLIVVDDDLALRRFAGEADLPEFFRLIEESLDHLRPWMPWIADHDLAHAANWLNSRAEQWDSGREFSYAIVLDGALVGACGLFQRAEAPANGREIGYWLHPAATGRGAATRAARALTEQAFRLPGVDYVEIVHDTANRASGAVPARLGYTDHLRRPGVEPFAPGEGGEDRVWRLTRGQGMAGPGTGSGWRRHVGTPTWLVLHRAPDQWRYAIYFDEPRGVADGYLGHLAVTCELEIAQEALRRHTEEFTLCQVEVAWQAPDTPDWWTGAVSAKLP
jgi:RimJ/RimL family protein N-acetyltransferase